MIACIESILNAETTTTKIHKGFAQSNVSFGMSYSSIHLSTTKSQNPYKSHPKSI